MKKRTWFCISVSGALMVMACQDNGDGSDGVGSGAAGEATAGASGSPTGTAGMAAGGASAMAGAGGSDPQTGHGGAGGQAMADAGAAGELSGGAGGLALGEPCGDASRACGDGLACCYPCGIQGCESVCTEACSADEPGCANGCFLYP